MSITKTKIFEVFEDKKRRRLYTENVVKGFRLSDEHLVSEGKKEFREWDPYSSKLAAAIVNKSTNIGIRKKSTVLYLGSATGTTVSHVSDIVGEDGFIFAVDPAPRVMRDFVFHMEKRNNVCPILEDANHVEKLSKRIAAVDIVYQDIAQKNQVSIFLKNIDFFLKKGGYGIITLKARSVDVTKKPKEIFKQVRSELEKHHTIIDSRSLEPFQKDHMMFIVKK